MLRNIWIFFIFLGLCQKLSIASNCKSRGRFPNDNKGDCSGYAICLISTSGFLQYNLTCPSSFIYNHIHNQCTNSTSYQCYSKYSCSEPGMFRYAESKLCNKYIACVEGLNNITTARLIECPNNQVFSLITKKCVNVTEFDCEGAMELPNLLESADSDIDNHNYYHCNEANKMFHMNSIFWAFVAYSLQIVILNYYF